MSELFSYLVVMIISLLIGFGFGFGVASALDVLKPAE